MFGGSPRRAADDEGPATADGVDLAVLGEQGQGAAHGDPRDAELVAQLALGGQLVPGRSASDPIRPASSDADPLGHVGRGPGNATGRHTERLLSLGVDEKVYGERSPCPKGMRPVISLSSRRQCRLVTNSPEVPMQTRGMVVLAGSLALAACTTPGASTPAPTSSSTGAVSTDVSGLPEHDPQRLDVGERLPLRAAQGPGRGVHQGAPEHQGRPGRCVTSAPTPPRSSWRSPPTTVPTCASATSAGRSTGRSSRPGCCVRWTPTPRPTDGTTRYPAVGLRQLKFTPDGKKFGEGSMYGMPVRRRRHRLVLQQGHAGRDSA